MDAILKKLALALVLAAPCAAITRTALGSAADKTSVTTWTALTSITVNSGDYIIVGLSTVNDTWGTLSGDTIKWNSLTLCDGSGSAPADKLLSITSQATAAICSLRVTTTATASVVVTWASADSAHAVFALSVNGLASSSAKDITSGNGGNSSTPSDSATTTTQASEILVGNLATNGPSGDLAGTWSNSWTAGQRNGTTGAAAASNRTVQEGFKILSATEASQAALTGITSRAWIIIHVSYSATPVTASKPHQLTTLGVGE